MNLILGCWLFQYVWNETGDWSVNKINVVVNGSNNRIRNLARAYDAVLYAARMGLSGMLVYELLGDRKECQDRNQNSKEKVIFVG